MEARTWGAGYLYVFRDTERQVSNERLTGRVANHLRLNDAQTSQHTGGRVGEYTQRVHEQGGKRTPFVPE